MSLLLMGVGGATPEFPPVALEAEISLSGLILDIYFQEPTYLGVGTPTMTVGGESATLTYVSGEGTDHLVYAVLEGGHPAVTLQPAYLSAAAGVWTGPPITNEPLVNFPVTNYSEFPALKFNNLWNSFYS